ncbi:hypothetical protein EJ357_22680 [Streptomyces cyaneochromogenes]|uniref:Uncharacterized protein n=1 Tax=Streptomyces cyaneochromogenes TaxID=2496836 RepID=A0A3S9M9I6_9ACTN|nr:hypothetical protein [Streptomyces cyaneochromogenes]AZQ35939.1 hypothetical protein EJ357_22680 [Streptomyces cyaneochromogenes]
MTTRVEITEEQLPEQLRPLLAAYRETRQKAADAFNDQRVAPVHAKHQLQAPLDEANRAASEAHTALLEGSREHPQEIRQYSHARFAACVERAREHLVAAEQELRKAAGHAAVHASVRDGRPTVNAERGQESPGKKAAMFAIGLVQDAAGSLPDGID